MCDSPREVRGWEEREKEGRFIVLKDEESEKKRHTCEERVSTRKSCCGEPGINSCVRMHKSICLFTHMIIITEFALILVNPALYFTCSRLFHLLNTQHHPMDGPAGE